MKINLSKKQYEIIIKALEMSSFVYADISDFVDKKYKKEIGEIESVQEELLEYARDFDFEKNLEDFEGTLHTKEEYYDKILDDLSIYDDHQVFENLSKKLGWRDFRTKYTKEEIDKISKKHNGYLGVPLYDFEKKYYDEFEKNEYSRLYIRE